VVARALVVLAIAACSSKPRPEDAAHGIAGRDGAPPGPGDAGAAPDGDASRPEAAVEAATARGATGDLQIRVVWPDVPASARSSPGSTPCQTPRAPSVTPTTTWGIPEVLVVVEGAAPPVAVAQLRFADCAIAPRIAVGASLAITSAAERPAKLVLRKRGTFDHLVAGEPVPVMLPIAGHTVTTSLDAGSLYEVATDAPQPEVSFIAVMPDGYVTEANGQTIARNLAAGSHAVTAWLPPRAGVAARIGRGTATVVAGELAELTVTLAP
jgi:hypothetical protein